MLEYSELFNIWLDTLRKLLYPEEWIKLDLYLSKSELLTLLQVDRNGEIIMSRIADYVNIPMSTATGLVERLVKKGLLERTRNESDRRIVTVRLTNEGKKLADELKDSVMRIVGQVFDTLEADERELLESIFMKITDILSGGFRKPDVSNEDGGAKIRRIEVE